MVLMLICFLKLLLQGQHILNVPDCAFWLGAWAAHIRILRNLPLERWSESMHTATALLFAGFVADSVWLGIDHAALWYSDWAGVIFLSAGIALPFGVTKWAGRAAHHIRWLT
jgi:hypothetical protein